MTPETLTLPEVTSLIRRAVNDRGGSVKFAAKLDITPTHVEGLLRGKKPGPRVMRAIGVTEAIGGGWVRL